MIFYNLKILYNLNRSVISGAPDTSSLPSSLPGCTAGLCLAYAHQDVQGLFSRAATWPGSQSLACAITGVQSSLGTGCFIELRVSSCRPVP